MRGKKHLKRLKCTDRMRVDWIDLTKGIAIFLMVCGHTGLPGALSNWIWSFHMPLFMMISGFFAGNIAKYSFGKFLKKKFIQLIFPCIIYGFLCSYIYIWR